jgi:hypothetical protein
MAIPKRRRIAVAGKAALWNIVAAFSKLLNDRPVSPSICRNVLKKLMGDAIEQEARPIFGLIQIVSVILWGVCGIGSTFGYKLFPE